MSAYTCNSCVLHFDDGALQREHMKSDWHRYNLKRRVAQLPPITELVFKSKVSMLATGENESQGKTKQLTKKEMRRREKEALLEKKKKLLELAKQSMMKNMKEGNMVGKQSNESVQENVIKTEEEEQVKKEEQEKENVGPEAVKEATSDEELTEEQLAEKLMAQKLANKVDIPLESCLFCRNKTFSTFEENLEHMFKSHGFYIPEQKYLIDKEGLVTYMSEKIGLGNVCIVCNYQGKDIEAVRAHMLSKRHCKIPYESENEKLEISEFYNFSSTYEKFDQANIINEADLKQGDNDEDWEDVEDEEVEDEDEAPREYLYHDEYELHLPTGVKVGHRSLQRYFKQSLKPEIVLTEGQGTLVAAETRTFLPAFDKGKIQVQKQVWQTEVKDLKRDSKRKAKFVNNQPYYRDQLLQ